MVQCILASSKTPKGLILLKALPLLPYWIYTSQIFQITREIKSKYSTEYRICFKAVSSVSFSTFQIKPHSSKMPILQKNSFAFSDGHAFISPTLKNMFHKVTASRNFTLSRLKNVYKWMSHAFRLICMCSSLHLCVAPCQWAGWWDAWLLFADPDPCWRAAH